MSHSHGHGNESGDIGPGMMNVPGDRIREGVQGYLIGLAGAAILTIISFSIAGTHLIWGPSIPIALVVMAVAQIGVHLVFFLHLTTAPDNTNNILALAFGVLIVALLVGGSVWIMSNLNANMMPMERMQGMMQMGR